MNRIPRRLLVATLLCVLAVAAYLVFYSLKSYTRPCGILSINPEETYSVQGSYSTWTLMGDRCEKKTPKNITLHHKTYSLRINFMKNSNPRAFLGLVSNATQHEIIAPGIRRKPDHPAYAGHWYSHSTSDAQLEGSLIAFKVKNTSTGETTSHSYPYSVVSCTCRTIDYENVIQFLGYLLVCLLGLIILWVAFRLAKYISKRLE